VFFPDTTIIPYQVFLHGYSLIRLDYPGPVEYGETISDPNSKKS